MPELGLLAWVLLGIGALAVGLSKTALPGVNTVSVAIFAALLPAKESTGALLVLLMVGDACAVWMYRRDADWPAIVRLVPTVIGGLVLGAVFLFLADDEWVRRVIGSILLAMIAVTLAQRAAARRPGREPGAERQSRLAHQLQTATYGTLAGFTTMAANAAGPVMSMYLLASRFSVRRFLGTAAWFFAIVNVIKLPFSISIGLITRPLLLVDLVLVPMVLLGALAGGWLARRIQQDTFDRIIIVVTVLGSLYLLR